MSIGTGIRRVVIDGLATLGVVVAAFLMFRLTVAPTLGGVLDSAEFQHAAYGLQIVHPTGYPLYLLLGKLWITIVPFGDPAHRLNLLSAALMAVAAGGAYLVGRTISGSRAGGLLAAALFATAEPVWRQASVAEGDALNVALASGAFLSFVVWYARRGPIELPALLVGAALSHHRTSAFYVVPLVVAGGWLAVQRQEPRTRLLAAGLALLAPWLLYVYIPLRAWTSPWYGNTWEGFVTMVTGRDAVSSMASALRQGLAARAQSVLLDLIGPMIGSAGLSLCLIAVMGWVWPRQAGAGAQNTGQSARAADPGTGVDPSQLARQTGRLTEPIGRGPVVPIVWLLSFLGVTGFALVYNIADLDRYLIVPLWLAFTWSAFGVASLQRFAGRWPVGNVLAWVLIAAAFAQPVITFQTNRPRVDFSQYRWEYTRWDTALRAPIEPDALIFGSWGDINDVRYFQTVEARRTDLATEEVQSSRSLAELANLVRQRLQADQPTYFAQYPAELAYEFGFQPAGRVWRPLPVWPRLPIARSIDARFGEQLRLLRVEQGPRRIEPGGTLEFRLTWIANSAVRESLIPWLVVVDSSGHPVPDFPEPVSGLATTTSWSVDTEVLTAHGVFPPDRLDPGRYEVYLSLRRPNGEPLKVADAAGTSVGDGLVVASFARQPASTTGSAPDGNAISFGAQIRLVGGSLGPGPVRPGSVLPVLLTWEAKDELDTDYTVSVQILDSAGRLVAQQDQQPQRGAFPTSAWLPGERIADQVQVRLPADLRSGQYRVAIVMYQLGTGARLMTPFGDQAPLETFSVEPAR